MLAHAIQATVAYPLASVSAFPADGLVAFAVEQVHQLILDDSLDLAADEDGIDTLISPRYSVDALSPELVWLPVMPADTLTRSPWCRR